MNENLPSVAVVILSWNGRKFLEQFLPPLLKTTYTNVSYYVADNASTDDTVEFVNGNFPQVKIIRIEKNEGFAEGYNVALKSVKSDYYVLLNQDVEVTPGWIEPVIEMMEKEKSIGVVQPKLRAFHARESFEYAGAAGGFIDKHGYAFCKGRFFHSIEKDTGQYEQAGEIVWCSGACMFIRPHLFHDLGGFDADYFAHFEEIDLCWRIKNAGYKVQYCPASVVYHVGGGSLPQGNPRKTFLNFRNNLYTIVKNFPGSTFIPCTLLRFVLDIISAYKQLFEGKWRDFFAIFRAHYHFVFHLPALIKKRKYYNGLIQQHQIGKPNLTGFYKGSIIVDFFIRGIRNFSGLKQENFYK